MGLSSDVASGQLLFKEAARQLAASELSLSSACKECDSLSARCAALTAELEAATASVETLRPALAAREVELRVAAAGAETLRLALVLAQGQVQELQRQLDAADAGAKAMRSKLEQVRGYWVAHFWHWAAVGQC